MEGRDLKMCGFENLKIGVREKLGSFVPHSTDPMAI